MFETIKDYINTGRYELKELTEKINTLWVESELTDDEREALLTLAQENANSENSYAPLQEQIEQAFEQIKALESRVVKLETGGEEPEPSEEYPEYVNPTGAHDAYYKDDKVTYNGKKYICIAPDGVACVWSPDVYPQYWKEVTE